MDRDDGGEIEERRCIRESSKSLKKYGSTAKHVTRNENLVKHTVSKTDTLQGIALKYGVTTEQIRRLNRLWASDSLFLREHLLIPLSTESPAYVSYDQVPVDSVTSPSSITSSLDEEGSVDEFLAKLDCSIASMKKVVTRAQGNSEFCNELGEPVNQRNPPGRLRNSQNTASYASTSSSEASRPSSSGDAHNLPSAVVMTQGRRVKTSLQRLQQQQDEMFQL